MNVYRCLITALVAARQVANGDADIAVVGVNNGNHASVVCRRADQALVQELFPSAGYLRSYPGNIAEYVVDCTPEEAVRVLEAHKPEN